MATEGDGIPLFGDIYRKCAAFFAEIDNAISLESFEYAENQLLTAGANAKQACSKLMQVMLPEFLMDSLQETSPSPEENRNSELSAKDPTDGQISHNPPSSTEDTPANQRADDLDGVKDINIESPNAPLDSCIMVDGTKMVEQSTSLAKSLMKIEEKCECLDVTGSEVHHASDCPRRKMSQDEDLCESDWEII